MLRVLRIERVGLVPAALVTHAEPTTTLYVRPTRAEGNTAVSEPCVECIRVEAAVPMTIAYDGRNHQVVTGTLLRVTDVPTDAVWVDVSMDGPFVNGKLPRVSVVYGRCEASMRWLDELYRAYVLRFPFKRSLAIRAVAGSGKTTTLLQLAAKFAEQRDKDPTLAGKRILYVAFNKQLVEDLRGKLHEHALTNVLTPTTFDALVKRVAEAEFAAKGQPFHLTGALTPQALTDHLPWFQGKAVAMKRAIIKQFATFCQHPTATTPDTLFPGKAMVKQLWDDTLSGRLLTFDGLRKRAHLEHWMRDRLDAQYARVFVDEAQDFDPIMLDILLTDTTVPKVFVGDPKQQIYEWRGTINAFERLPDNTLTLELYKTFRMGEPATSAVANLTKTPMISGVPDRDTRLTTDVTHATMPHDVPYTYLFRTWRGLLTTAQTIAELHPDITYFVHDFDRQMQNIEWLHDRLLRGGKAGNGFDEDDEMPAFLMKLTHEELAALKTSIESRRVRSPGQARCKLYTIHSFKGLEDAVVRVAGDVDPTTEPNLHYVALTRGTGRIYADVTEASSNTNGRRTTDKAAAKPPKAKAAPLATLLAALSPEERTLAEALALLRSERAKANDKPPYMVFTNKVLLAIAQQRPTNTAALLEMHGVGDKMVQNVGVAVLELVAGC